MFKLTFISQVKERLTENAHIEGVCEGPIFSLTVLSDSERPREPVYNNYKRLDGDKERFTD